jgi:hypothetical protein
MFLVFHNSLLYITDHLRKANFSSKQSKFWAHFVYYWHRKFWKQKNDYLSLLNVFSNQELEVLVLNSKPLYVEYISIKLSTMMWILKLHNIQVTFCFFVFVGSSRERNFLSERKSFVWKNAVLRQLQSNSVTSFSRKI